MIDEHAEAACVEQISGLNNVATMHPTAFLETLRTRLLAEFDRRNAELLQFPDLGEMDPHPPSSPVFFG